MKKNYMKFKTWDDTLELKGTFTISLKIDGVHAVLTDEGVFSRHGKPLYNLDKFWEDGMRGNYEVYLDDFKKSIQAVRTQTHMDIEEHHMYRLDILDPRLHIEKMTDPQSDIIQEYMEEVTDEGHEGLILHKVGTDIRYKVKPFETYDVEVTDIQPGAGKHEGRMGALITPMGKVGTGFDDASRELDWQVGTIIEVKCMQLTPNGKFRHPVYLRTREDK